MVRDFFQTVDKSIFTGLGKSPDCLGNSMLINKSKFPDLQNVDIAIVGLGKNADLFRKAFYTLSNRFAGITIADLGNIRNDKDKRNLAFGLTEVIIELIQLNICPLIIGEADDYTTACTNAFTGQIDLAMVAPRINTAEDSTLQQLMEMNKLFHLSLLTPQTYFVAPDDIEAIESVFYETLRLGDFRADNTEAEPLLRQSDVFTFDTSAIKAGEFGASIKHFPNGLYNEEACLLSRYAGISNKISTALFYGFDLNKGLDTDAMQLAQMAWYFADGIDNRFNDNPDKNHPNFMVYTCHISKNQDIVFIKSLLTERWWMEIPVEAPAKKGKKIKSAKPTSVFIGCTANDFEIAKSGELPEKWYKAAGKLMN
ncbi:MAG: hypothetical protein H7321_01475 [Bacteroidia bacterium]|nr:hypothetical protein [Bacteroidia bacterium]